MAVGKGSMARASKAAAKKGDANAAVIANPDEKVVETVVAEVKEEAVKAEAKKATAKKTTTKKTTTKKSAPKKAEAEVKVETEEKVEIKTEPEVETRGNEFCLIGEEMPVYLF